MGRIFLNIQEIEKITYIHLYAKLHTSAYNSYGEALFGNMIRMLPKPSIGDAYT